MTLPEAQTIRKSDSLEVDDSSSYSRTNNTFSSDLHRSAKAPSTFKYRPDIDGLRCVAVLSVILFHLSPARLSGGFVGVDVFFVISGYLISAIVFSDIANARFSVVGFYERRIRRIFPALFAMLLVVSAAMSYFLLPTEFVEYAKSVFTATASASNFYFWQHSGYFDAPTTKPLLHTWSLAVEEQFYILFPIFLVAMRRFFPRHLRLGVVLLSIASLAVSAVTVHRSPSTAFYMPYTRAWELLVGTMVSLRVFPRLPRTVSRNFAAALGLAMIVYAVFRYSPDTPFPGLAALVPCIGSALIIGAGESGPTLTGRMLSRRPVVFIGLISYSLYLWHWPLIVLNDMGLSFDLSGIAPHKWADFLLTSATSKLEVLVLSFVLAFLSWRFVERPFRSRFKRIGRRSLFALSGAIMLLLLLSSAAAVYARGFPSRFPGNAVQVASVLTPPGSSNLGQLGDCSITESNLSTVFADGNQCLPSHVGVDDYLLVGDSHAGALRAGVATILPKANVALAAVWGCRPSIQSEGSAACKQMMSFLFQKYLPTHPIRGLLLEARWYADSLNDLGAIVSWGREHNVRVVIFGPVAEYDAPLPRLLAYSISRNEPDLPQKHRIPYSPEMDATMKDRAANTWRACYVSIYQATCERDRCLEYADQDKKTPILSDADHLTEEGSVFLMNRLARDGELACLKNKPEETTQGSR
jgi:peptidoglycan/LPS O-acetylase OafA/YrhL